MQDLTITLVQTSLAWEDTNANLEHFSKLLDETGLSTDLVILPEMFNTGFTMNASGNYEEMNGLSMSWMAETAREKGSVICGSMIIREQGKYFNRLIWMRPDQSFDYYDKKHLFRMGDEHLHFSSGNKKLIVTIKGWKVMPLICYDLRFPVWSKNQFSGGEYDFDLMVYVANWPVVRSVAWNTLLRARAIENMACVAGVNRTGTDGRGYEYGGGSMLAAPDGSVICSADEHPRPAVSCVVSPAPLIELRRKLGVGNDWDPFSIS